MRDDLSHKNSALEELRERERWINERRATQQREREEAAAQEAALKERLRPLHDALTRAKEDPEVRAILERAGLIGTSMGRSEMVETTAWKNARAQIERLDRERGGIKHSHPIPEQDPPQPEALRRKSGPSGPKF